jgi:phage anti-repressor protein
MAKELSMVERNAKGHDERHRASVARRQPLSDANQEPAAATRR